MCDVEAETLKQIHDGADKVKPSSITVRYVRFIVFIFPTWHIVDSTYLKSKL